MNALMQTYEKAVYVYLRAIAKGRVVTYGQIARKLGIGSPRLVGRILHNNPDPDGTPCYKVVFADGSLSAGYAAGGLEAQRRRLHEDGVRVVDDRVDLALYGWDDAEYISQ